MKSAKNLAREVLRAQGVWDEPTSEAVKVMAAAMHAKWAEGYDAATIDYEEGR